MCSGLVPEYTHCFSCCCDQITDKKQLKEENVGFGLQFQEAILHHTEEAVAGVTEHLQSGSRVNKQGHREPQGPPSSDLLTPVRLPPPKGSFKTEPPAGNQVFKYTSQWGNISHSNHNTRETKIRNIF